MESVTGYITNKDVKAVTKKPLSAHYIFTFTKLYKPCSNIEVTIHAPPIASG